MIRSMYAVCATENCIEDLTAMFDDETQAEEYAKKLSGDPDFDGCDYEVVRINLDASGVTEQEIPNE